MTPASFKYTLPAYWTKPKRGTYSLGIAAITEGCRIHLNGGMIHTNKNTTPSPLKIGF